MPVRIHLIAQAIVLMIILLFSPHVLADIRGRAVAEQNRRFDCLDAALHGRNDSQCDGMAEPGPFLNVPVLFLASGHA